MKKFIPLISLILVVFCSTLVFADSSEASSADLDSSSSAEAVVLPSSALLATVTDENEIALDNELRSLSASLASTSDSGYTADDIYNLLIGVRMYYQGNYQFRVYDSTVIDRLNTVNTYLYDFQSIISSMNSNIYSLNSNLATDNSSTIGSILVDLANVLGCFSTEESMGNTIWQNIRDIKSLLKDSTNSISIGDSLASISESNAYIYNRLADIRTDIGLFRSDFVTYFGNLHTVLNNRFDDVENVINVFADDNHTDLTAIDSSVDDFASANHTDLSSIDTSISDFADDFNHVDWGSMSSINYLGLSNSLSQSPSFNYSTSHDVYAYYNGGFNEGINIIARFVLPLRSITYLTYDDIELELGGYWNDLYRVFDCDYSYVLAGNYLNIFIYDFSSMFYNGFTNFVIHLHSDSLTFNNYNLTFHQQLYLDSNSSDFYTVYDWLVQRSNQKVVDKFEYLYASDDLIAAKEAQQEQEDTALSEFTGSGSAAASKSDLTDAKGVSNALKNGLDTGGSSSNALAVFDSANAFWGWFSTDCRSYFNVVVPSDASPSPVLRSVRSTQAVPDLSNFVWTDDVPDVLSDIDAEYYNNLGAD